MKEYASSYFGTIDLDSPESDYDSEISLNRNLVNLDLSIELSPVNPATLNAIEAFLKELEDYDSLSRQFMDFDYASTIGDTVKFYVNTCLEYIDKAGLAEIVDFKHPALDVKTQIIQQLRLEQITFSTDTDSHFAAFDYTINKEDHLINDLIVIYYDHSQQIEGITIES